MDRLDEVYPTLEKPIERSYLSLISNGGERNDSMLLKTGIVLYRWT